MIPALSILAALLLFSGHRALVSHPHAPARGYALLLSGLAAAAVAVALLITGGAP